MRQDSLKKYVTLRRSLEAEKASLEARLRSINAALGEAPAAAAPARRGRPPGQKNKKKKQISAAGKARIAEAQRLRWAAFRAGKKKK